MDREELPVGVDAATTSSQNDLTARVGCNEVGNIVDAGLADDPFSIGVPVVLSDFSKSDLVVGCFGVSIVDSALEAAQQHG